MQGRSLTVGAVAAVMLLTLTTTMPAGTLATSSPQLARATSTLVDLGTPVVSLAQGWDGAEQSVLVDRALGFVLVGDVSSSSTDQVHRSTDDGVTWQTANAPQTGNTGLGDGTALAQDVAGVLYAANTNGPVITISTSTNHGLSWTAKTYVPAGLADRPWLATGAAPGQVALVANDGARTDCFYSTDGATTWASASSAPLDNIAGNLAFDAAGHLWFTAHGILYEWQSPCFGSPATFSTTVGNAIGANIQTQVAVAGTPTNAYIAVPDANNDQMQLRGIHGQGVTSPKTVVVSPSTVLSNAMGAVAAKSDDSQIAVLWYGSSTAGDPSNSAFPATATWNTYVTRVTGFWTATPTVTTTTVATNVHHGWICMAGTTCTSGRALLDYIGITYASDGTLRATWGNDAATGTTHTYYADLH